MVGWLVGGGGAGLLVVVGGWLVVAGWLVVLGLSQGFFSILGQIDAYIQCLRPLGPHAIREILTVRVLYRSVKMIKKCVRRHQLNGVTSFLISNGF